MKEVIRMNNKQIIQEATEAVEKGLPCAFLVKPLLEVAKNQKATIERQVKAIQAGYKLAEEQKAEIAKKDTEIGILIRKKEALRDEIADQQAEIERMKNAYKQCAWERDVFSEDINAIKSEAYRELAERVKEEIKKTIFHASDTYSLDLSYEPNKLFLTQKFWQSIDNTLRELTESNE
jgi:archaellum component FlaC